MLKAVILQFAVMIALIGIGDTSAFGATVINVPADQPTIQAGINAAVNGDTVLVAPGSYVENINFLGKAITVKGASGPKVTIIDGGHSGSVVTFNSGEPTKSVLRGFTVRNGSGTGAPLTEGGGIEISNSSPTIVGNIISQNVACDGAGMAITNGGSPIISKNQIIQNSGGACSGLGGGGIYILGGRAPRIVGNMISDNTMCCANGGAIYVNYTIGSPTIANNIINNNIGSGSGGGIYAVNQVDANLIQNVVTRNTAGAGAGIYWQVPGGTRGPFLINNTFFGNTVNQNCVYCEGSALYIGGFYSTSVLENNLFIGPAGKTALFCDGIYSLTPPITVANDAYNPSGSGYGGICDALVGTKGNISTDPKFVNSRQQHYQLSAASPAIDVGDNSAPKLPTLDAAANPRTVDGNGDGTATVDMGAYEFQ